MKYGTGIAALFESWFILLLKAAIFWRFTLIYVEISFISPNPKYMINLKNRMTVFEYISSFLKSTLKNIGFRRRLR
jgi:hypothetical protein